MDLTTQSSTLLKGNYNIRKLHIINPLIAF